MRIAVKNECAKSFDIALRREFFLSGKYLQLLYGAPEGTHKQ